MKKVLIGVARSKGNFTENGREIKYNNLKLYVAEFREKNTKGFVTLGTLTSIKVGDQTTDVRKIVPISVRVADFEEVAGVSAKYFYQNFEKEYMFHRVRVISEENNYGRQEVIELKFSEDNCWVLNKKLMKRESDDSDSDDLDDSPDSGAEDNFDDDSDDDFDFDISDVDKESGEIGVKKVKKE